MVVIATLLGIGSIALGHGYRRHLVKNIRSIGPSYVIKSGTVNGSYRSIPIYTPNGLIPTFYKEPDRNTYTINSKKSTHEVEYYYGQLGHVNNTYITDGFGSDDYKTLKYAITLHILGVFYSAALLCGLFAIK